MDKIKQFFKNNYSEVLKPIIVLFLIAVVVAASLAGANMITSDRIAELQVKSEMEMMETLFKNAEFEKKTDDTGEYNAVIRKGETVGYIFSEKAKGYGGDISVMVAVNTDGTIKTVRVLDVSGETPGLGQNVAKEDFYKQFESLSGQTEVKKVGADPEKGEVKPVSGATISSKGVKNAVNSALERFEKIAKSHTGGVGDEK